MSKKVGRESLILKKRRKELNMTQSDVADAIGQHVTSIAHLRLKGTELVAVVTAQSVPSGKP